MNAFQKIGIKVADFGKRFAGTIGAIIGLAVRVEHVLQSEKPLEKPFISGSDGAFTADGLNFSADSKVYSGFLTLIDDFKKLAPVVDEAITLLEIK
jgi:hypothetical protein